MNTPINATEHAAAVEAGRASVAVKERVTDWQGLPVIAGVQGVPALAKDLLEAQDARAERPRRRVGHFIFTELPSFQDWLNRMKLPETVVFADIAKVSLTAIINAHVPTEGVKPPKSEGSYALGNPLGAAGWCDFRASYSCPRSPEWLFWTALEGKAMSQEQFADVVDARMEDLTSGKGYPEPMEILEMCRNLQIRIAGEYRRQIDPTTGTGTLVSKTEHGAESTKIPRCFCLALRIFEGGQQYRVEARIRFDLDGGRPRFKIELHRRAELERHAFTEIRESVQTACKVPVFAGSL